MFRQLSTSEGGPEETDANIMHAQWGKQMKDSKLGVFCIVSQESRRKTKSCLEDCNNN